MSTISYLPIPGAAVDLAAALASPPPIGGAVPAVIAASDVLCSAPSATTLGGFRIIRPGGGDQLYLGYSGASYAGALAWLAPSRPFIYTPNSDTPFRIGIGSAATSFFEVATSGICTAQQFRALASLTVGSGTPVLAIRSAVASLDYPSIAAGGTADLTITLTGVAANANSICHAAFTGTPPADNIQIIAAWISAPNTASVRVRNTSAAAIDPAAAAIRAITITF